MRGTIMMRTYATRIFLTGNTLLFSLLLPLCAETYYVSPSGNHTSPYTNWITAATSIHAAVSIASTNDAILVTNGMYDLTSTITIAQPITLRSVNGANATIVDAHRACRCFYLNGSDAIVDGLTIRNGYTTSHGGGMYIMGVATVINCNIAGNESRNQGGGVYCNNQMFMTNCTIVSNTAVAYGGGVFQGDLHRCNISHNYVNSYGGGVARATCHYCEIRNNQSNHSGGGAREGTLNNCIVAGNETRYYGGGVYSATLKNCTIVNNECSYRGGGTYSGSIYNSIVYYNKDTSGRNNNWGGTFRYSCVTPYVGGEGNITNAPEIISLNNPRIASLSPCIDAGLFSYAPGDLDMDGEPRIWGDNVDMGADEYYEPGMTGLISTTISLQNERIVKNIPVTITPTVNGKAQGCLVYYENMTFTNQPYMLITPTNHGTYEICVYAWNNQTTASSCSTLHVFNGYTTHVSHAGTGISPFTNWVSAATTIQEAVNACIPGGLIVVTNGVYQTGKSITEGILFNRVSLTNSMALQSVNGPTHTCIKGTGPLGSNAVRCICVSAGSRLVGFTLSNGYTRADINLAEEDLCGGAIWGSEYAMISNCHIRNSHAALNGGGIYQGCIVDSLIEHNTAAYDGGGVYAGQIVNSRILNNTSSHDGGGICYGNLTNCIVISNSADYGGGAAWCTNNACTIVDNTATWSGGGVYRAISQNSIIYFNNAYDWANYFSSICEYTCTTPNPQATGSITNQPLFSTYIPASYHLSPESPCIDAGTNVGLKIDFEGTPRPLKGSDHVDIAICDMGAIEYSPIHYVAPGGENIPPYVFWTTAAHTVQSAIDMGEFGDTILVSNGLYNSGTSLGTGETSNRVVVPSGLHVMSTGNSSNTCISGSGPMGNNAVRCVYVYSNASIAGFTISNGYTRNVSGYPHDLSGGGIYCETEGRISTCLITDNHAFEYGGGIAKGQLVNCLIISNEAANGGGVYNGNIRSCTICGNIAGNEGGGIAHCTSVNSIIHFNTASSKSNYLNSTLTYSSSTPLPGGIGNISDNPSFATQPLYSLQPGSPCIDTGTNTADLLDYIMTPRPLDGNNDGTAITDMGIYEYINVEADSDHDQLNDTNELAIGTNPTKTDTDGDFQSDFDEVIAGVNPLDSNSFFAINTAYLSSNDQQRIYSWLSVTGRLYSVWSTTNLLCTWTNDANFGEQSGTGTNIFYTNSVTGQKHYFQSISVRKTD